MSTAAFHPAMEVDPSRANNALAYYMMLWLRVQVAINQQEEPSQRSDLPPFALATWSSFMALLTVPHLRVESGFPMTLAWLRSMQEQTTQLVGMTCLHEQLSTSASLTTDERCWAASGRSAVIGELGQFPTWIESRVEQLHPGLRLVVQRYVNAISELFYEMFNLLGDDALECVANRAAECCICCRFERPHASLVSPAPFPTSSATGRSANPMQTPDVIDHRALGPMPVESDPGRRHDLQSDSSGESLED